MRISAIAVSVGLVLTFVGLSGCSAKSTSNSNTTANSANPSTQPNDAPKDNVDEFQMLVQLPFTPEEVVWKETAVESSGLPDAPTKRLIAVMRFTPDRAARLSEQAAKTRPPTADRLDTEPWYPAELIAQAGTNGEGKLTGKSYAADEFLLPPYTQGKLTRIENTDYFTLELFGR